MKKNIFLLVLFLISASTQAQYIGGIGDGFSSFINNNLSITLEQPILIQPTQNAINIPISILLEWQPVSDANSYNLQLSTNFSFETNLINEFDITKTNYDINSLNYNNQYFWRVRCINDLDTSSWSEAWNFTTIFNPLNINLNNGWNMISSNKIPINASMMDIFDGFYNKITIIKNGFGQICFPSWGINQIGDWNLLSGYQVNVVESFNMSIIGEEIQPENHPIQLFEGWYLISYLRNSPMPANLALESISANLVFAKDRMGNIYHPEFGINSIGSMQPSQGYWIYVSAPCVLTYPEN